MSKPKKSDAADRELKLIGFSEPPNMDSPVLARPHVVEFAAQFIANPGEWAEVTLTPYVAGCIGRGASIFKRGEWRKVTRGQGDAQRTWIMYAGPVDANGLNEAERNHDCTFCRAQAGERCMGKRYYSSEESNTHAVRWALVDQASA